MRTSLGISAGNEVVCSALVATGPGGEQNFDYRVVSADAAHSDLGDLVSSSIEMMTTRFADSQPTHTTVLDVLGERHPPQMARTRQSTSVAVAYRSKEQAQVIRAATGKQRDLRLVPEGTAALTFLRETGLLARYGTVAVVDLGATGLTVTVADPAEGAVLHSERTNAVSGNIIDELIYHHLVEAHYARRGTRPNRSTLVNRGRAAKEHLSVAPVVTIDHVAGQPLKLTRADFEELIADLLRSTAQYAAGVFARAPRLPEAVAVIGGCANIPAVVDTLAAELEVPVYTVPDPEAVIAKGAALVADAAPSSPLGGSEAPVGTVTKVVGTLAGVIVVVGLVIGYGVNALSPDAPDVSPVGTSSTGNRPPTAPVVPAPVTTAPNQESTDRTGVVAPPVEVSPSTTTPPVTTTAPATGTTTTPSPTGPTTTAPTLRPDPNLPRIPYPANPPLDSGSAGGEEEGATTTPPSATQSPAHSLLPIPLPLRPSRSSIADRAYLSLGE
ncbi:Hsp70 family protein [Nocardia thailandica]